MTIKTKIQIDCRLAVMGREVALLENLGEKHNKINDAGNDLSLSAGRYVSKPIQLINHRPRGIYPIDLLYSQPMTLVQALFPSGLFMT
jgi:hypothetical protein